MAVSHFIRIFLVYSGVQLLVLASGFAAEPMRLNLEQAIQAALERNLEFKSKQEELGIAEGRAIRSNLLLQHNPELEGDVSNRRLKKPEDGSNRNVPQGGLSLMQELEIGGQPTYRREAAQRNFEKVKFEVGDFERMLRFRITELFLRVLSTRTKIQQSQQVVELRNRLYEAAKTRLDAGDIPEVQLTTTEFELNRARSDLITLQRESEELLYRLKTELFVEDDRDIELTGNLARVSPPRLSLSELLKAALEKRPDLAALEREAKGAEAEERLTRAERIPNIRVGPFFERDDKDNIFGGRISIPLPVFDRKQGELREALARKTRANINYLNLRQSIEKTVRSAYARFALSEKDLSLYSDEIVKRFDDSLELYQRAYQERQIDLPELILFQSQVIEARVKFLDTLTNYNLSLAELKLQAGIE
jgi:cobalt-zinc-cadmium efflux system outer membrane protein